MIDHYIEDVFIPDILLEILSKNRVYENFELYSDENRIFYEIRSSYIDHVIRDMIKGVLKETTDSIVNNYLRKRYVTKAADEFDPLKMVTNDMFDNVLRQEMKKITQ